MGSAEEHLKKNLFSTEKIAAANFFSDLHKDKKFVLDYVALVAVRLAYNEGIAYASLKNTLDADIGKLIKEKTAKEIFDKEEGYVLNELSYAEKNLKHDNHNPMREHDVAVLKEWLTVPLHSRLTSFRVCKNGGCLQTERGVRE